MNNTLHIYFHPSDSEPTAIIDLPEKPDDSLQPPKHIYDKYNKALDSAIENRIQIVNLDNIRMNSKGELRFVESNTKLVGKLQELEKGEFYLWPGTFERLGRCKDCQAVG